jgi:hypothetical protein
MPVVHTREQLAAAWQYALPTGKPFLVSAALLRGNSAIMAKVRLQQVVKADRDAFGDGKWVKVSDGFYFEWPLDEPRPVFVAKKPRYRWERRR